MSSPGAFSDIEVTASEWLVKLGNADISAEDRGRFEAWLAQDVEHERVFRAQQDAWNLVAAMPHLHEETLPLAGHHTVASARRGVRRIGLLAMAAAVTFAVIGVISYQRGIPFFGGKRFATEVAQIKELRLDDGSVVSLGAASSIRVEFSDRQRRVTLLGGQAFFDVAHDAARPFFVSADKTTVRVVGTQFDVTRGAGTVRVSVLEGRVEVLQSGTATSANVNAPPANVPSHAAHALTAGQGAVISGAGRLAATFPVAQENLGAWRAGRLVYVDARLRDVVADVSRYYDGEIELTDPAVGDLQLTVAFRADQIDRMLDVLSRALPIEVRRVGEREIRLSPRH